MNECLSMCSAIHSLLRESLRKLQVPSAAERKLSLGPSPEERTVHGGERYTKKSDERAEYGPAQRDTAVVGDALLVVRDGESHWRGHETERHAEKEQHVPSGQV